MFLLVLTGDSWFWCSLNVTIAPESRPGSNETALNSYDICLLHTLRWSASYGSLSVRPSGMDCEGSRTIRNSVFEFVDLGFMGL